MIATTFASIALLLQVAAAPPAPPLLSTTPTPPVGAPAEPTSMSGLPLQVGDLPPGTVAVRVIRQSFADNVTSQPVELQVVGPSGKMLEARTDSAGRATFPGLSVGSVVFARTSLDGESLMSQQFELPAQGGVRLVLVAGIGAGSAATASPVASGLSAAASRTVAPDVPVGAASAVPMAMPSGSLSGSGVSAFAVPLLALATIGAGVWWMTARRRAHVASYDDLFEALVALEHAHASGRPTPDDYSVRRESLIEQLVSMRR